MKIEKTSVQVGLKQPIKVLHITDSHLTLINESDCAAKKALAQSRASAMEQFPGSSVHFLQEALAYGKENCDLIAHTGDLTDFVSFGNSAYASRFLKEEKVFFIAGNHEYSQYVGEAWEDDAYRMNSYMQIKDAFGVPLRFASRVCGGINFVGVDNGYYRFEDWQLQRLRMEEEKGLPVVLLLHDPLYEDMLFEEGMRRTNGACSYLVACGEERIARYGDEYRALQQRPDAATVRFAEHVAQSKRICAILAGHLHFSYTAILPSGICEIVTAGTYQGVAREITFE